MKASVKTIVLTVTIAAISPAQATESVLEEVIVSAQKREQNLQEVGIAVTAFSGDAIEKLGFVNSVDVSAQTPGLNFGGSEGGLNNILNIRGVSQNDIALHQEQPVTVYVDEGYISYPTAQQFVMFDLERVEVLKGPQGTLFGRNATGGLIHYVTRKPAMDEKDYYAALEVGQHGLMVAQGALGAPMSDTLAGRIAFKYLSNSDYVRAPYNRDADSGANDEFAVRASLRFVPSDDTEINFSLAAGANESNIGYGYQPTGFNADGLEYTLGPDENFWGTGPGAGITGFTADPNHITSQTTPGIFESDFLYANLNIRHQVSENTALTAVSTYLDFDANHFEDSDITPEDGVETTSDQKNKQFTQEIRLAGDLANGGNWVLGGFYMDRESFAFQRAAFYTPWTDHRFAVFGVTNPGDILGLVGDDIVRLDSDILLNTKSKAIFGQIEQPLSDSVTLVAGARYTHDKVDYNFVSNEYLASLGPVEGNLGTDGLLGASSFDGGFKDGAWSGKVQLDWNATDDTLVYFGVSRGIKSGGYNAPFFGGTVSSFDGEVLTSFEGGVKSSLTDTLRLNVAAFYYDYKDYQGFVIEDLALTLANTDAISKGMEVELIANPADGLDILFGAAYLDAELEDGNVMPYSPEWAFNGLIRKSWDTASGGLMAAQLSFDWQDEMANDTINNPVAFIGAQHSIDGRLSYTLPGGRTTLSLIGRNLTDEDNTSFVIPTGLGWAQMNFKRPRWISVEVRYNF